MIRLFLVCSSVLLGLVACGRQGLVEIVGIWPLDGGTLAAVDTSSIDLGHMNGDNVDTQQGLCLKNDGTSCGPEPFYVHVAVVRIANNYKIDTANPLYGVVTLKGFSVALTSIDADGPALHELSGSVRDAIGPEETRDIVLPLIDPDMKRDYTRAAPNDHHRYNASYLLQFENLHSLRVGTSIVLGPFSACPSDSTQISVCPELATP
jgi:hypothetical protein